MQYIDKVVDVPVVMQSCSACVNGGFLEEFFHMFYVLAQFSLVNPELFLRAPCSDSHFLQCSYVSLRRLLHEFQFFFVKVDSRHNSHKEIRTLFQRAALVTLWSAG